MKKGEKFGFHEDTNEFKSSTFQHISIIVYEISVADPGWGKMRIRDGENPDPG